MKRLTALILCLAAAGLAAAAPVTAKDRLVLLDVQPAAAPVPVLTYQLLPEVSELNPGNAYPAWLKCFAEQNNFFYAKEMVDERERLLVCPLSDIKPGSLKGYGGSGLRQADFAARLEYCDWNLLPQMREQGYMLLLPEIQQLRMLASALRVRGRGQLVDKDFDGAIRTTKTLFALARHLGEHPTIIAGLVGAAIAQICCNLLEELVQQPGAPNLYWALTQMPTPLVELRKAVSANRTIMEATFKPLLDRDRAWGPEDMAIANQKMKEVGSFLEFSADDRKAAETWIKERLQDGPWLTAARKTLIEAGYPAEPVGRYPPEQVVLMHLYQKSRVHHDEAIKWVPIAFWQAEPAIAELEKLPSDIEEKLTRQMVFAVGKIKTAHVRLEQRLAMLRIVEAIRLDAAKNGGKLPATLSDLSVPIPTDPVTGKAFEYKVDGMTGILGGKATAVSGGGTMQYRYEVRLRK